MAYQRSIHTLTSFLLMITTGLILVCCANPVSPTGGPKDEDPPTLVKAEPPLFTKNYENERIKITFSEFIQLKDVTNQVIISPPMDKMPDFKIKGKSLIIEFKEPLKENTTYNIFLGSAVVDLTEGNPAINFQYVFSTGNTIDSLSIKGNILKGFDLTPVENLNVMLYLDNNDTIEFDSLPYYVKPYYMTKTNKQGDFILNNLANRKFKLFGLLDLNSNLIYDQPTEEIAFLDSLITPWFISTYMPDTSILFDSVGEVKDTVELPDIKPVKLKLFQEIDSIQRLLKVILAKDYQLNFIFKLPVTDLQIQPMNLPEGTDWAIIEPNITKDTLICWLKNMDQDSVKLVISDAGEILDTIDIGIVRQVRTRKEKKEQEEIRGLLVRYNTQNSSINLNEPLILTFDYPIKSFNLDTVFLFENDTILVVPEIVFIDSIIQRKLAITYPWKQGTVYSMMIPDSVFFDIHGHSHDTLGNIFMSKILEDYGNLYVGINLLNPGENHIVQLLSNDHIIHERVVSENQRLSFQYLKPGKYRLKVIYDRNQNDFWDTGDYFYKKQPEVVDFFPAEINVRANWDIEEEWEL